MFDIYNLCKHTAHIIMGFSLALFLKQMENVKIISHTWERVITKEDLIKLHNIDEELYELVKFTANVWEQWQNKKDGSTQIIQLHQAKGEFKPIHWLVEYKDILFDVFKDVIPTIPLKHEENNSGILAVLPHTDLHIDRLENNPKKYLKKIDDTTMRLFENLLKFNPERIVYANIWDYFNSDWNYKTTKGTEQVNSMKEKEAFQMWLEHQLKTIETFASELPTDVIYVSWNHDDDKLQYLSDAVELYYRNNDNVRIDNWHDPRKYYNWGRTSLWFAHWDKIKDKDILALMAMENKLREYNYFYKGHIHHQLKQVYGNLLVETLWSPAITNEYEKKYGYIGINKIKGKLFDKKEWQIAEFEK